MDSSSRSAHFQFIFVKLIASLLLCSCFSAFATTLQPLNITQLDTLTLLPAELLVTKQSQTIDQVRRSQNWQLFRQSDLNPGVSNQAYWLRFTVNNPTDKPVDWVLKGETSYLDNLNVYVRPAGQTEFKLIQLSDRQHFNTRLIEYRTLSMPVSTPALNSQEIYIQAFNQKPDTVSLNFSLVNAAQLDELIARENFLFGLYYGAIGIVVLLSLLAAVLLKHSSAVFYALFLVSNIVFWLMLNGIGFQYIWPNWIWFHNEGFHLVYLAFCLAALEFGKHFLKLKKISLTHYRVFNLLQGLAIFGVILRLLGHYSETLFISYFCLLVLALLMPAAGYKAKQSGLSYAKLFCVAWLFYSIGLILGLLSATTNILPWGMFPLIWLQVASLLEVIFLVAAMTKWVVSIEVDRKKALSLANQDPLTGLGNRRRLQTAYKTYYKEFTQLNRFYSLYMIMLDLDYFKNINDTYGHEAGDYVLKHISQMIKQSCRKQDVAIRFGGEEFAILLPLSNIEQAVKIAERLRSDFEKTPTRYKNIQIRHTLSCGIVEVLSKETELSLDLMMSYADDALYQAKNSGRNIICIYDSNEHNLNKPSTSTISI